MKKPTAVHISTVHNFQDSRILYRECASLANNGFDVKLLITAPKKTIINNVEIIPLRKTSSRFIRFTKVAFQAFIKSLQLKADIYHFHDPELLPWMVLLKFTGKKIVFDVHENVVLSLTDREWLRHAQEEAHHHEVQHRPRGRSLRL